MSQSRVDALRRLIDALWDFCDSGEQSYGFDPDEVDFEAVDPGGYVHDAICQVQSFYDNDALPIFGPREAWSDLTRACRDDHDGRKARKLAKKLIKWAEGEIKAVAPPKPRTGTAKLDEVKDPTHGIADENRTRPLTKTEAARYLQLGHFKRPDRAISNRMENGSLRYEPVSQDKRRYRIWVNDGDE